MGPNMYEGMSILYTMQNPESPHKKEGVSN